MAKPDMAARGAVKAAILECLKASPSGKSARQVAATLDKHRDQIATRLGELQDQGKVIGVVVRADVGRSTKIWFLPEFSAQAAEAGPTGWARKRTKVKPEAPKRVQEDGIAITRAAPFVDRRWSVDGEVPSVVSTMDCRPWAEAASSSYGR
jgi:hypothetical protein